MRRREFIAGTAATAAFSSAPSYSQTGPKTAVIKRIAVVSPSEKVADMRIGGDARYDAFFDELKRLGYVEGKNLIVDRYSGGGVVQAYDDVVREVIRTNPDAVWSGGTPLTSRFKKLTSTIPIVASTGDPIRFGLVSSLAHPGGNITGVSVDAGIEIWGKRLALLGQVVPKLINVLLVSTQGGWDGAGGKAVRDAAQKLGISLVNAPLLSPFNEASFRGAVGSIQRDKVDGLTISDEREIYAYRFLLVELIQQIRIPAIYVHRDQVEAGGLMSYSYDAKAAARRNAMQIVEILHGANPADLPYFQETRFELAINLRTARTLGLEFPDGLIAAADEVIE